VFFQIPVLHSRAASCPAFLRSFVSLLSRPFLLDSHFHLAASARLEEIVAKFARYNRILLLPRNVADNLRPEISAGKIIRKHFVRFHRQ